MTTKERRFARKQVIKPSSLDARCPPDLEVVYQILIPSGGFSRNTPPHVLASFVDIDKAQEFSDTMRESHGFTTIWRDRETKKHVSKWKRLRLGTRRTFKLSVPWVEGMTDKLIIDHLKTAMVQLNDTYQGKTTVVAFNKEETR